ncbi:hypothetical protein [Emticicia sp. C21]|uniref:hypothetical protein n=1 Tax=Emticicia sp. C21 TaxID=2302915 RepID=UPI000E34BB30|nr:hypothetical protein [Emticicia sp. C21]RFS17356.1 hypothetical protein D0T08_06140 [Emticicia sp. C21]
MKKMLTLLFLSYALFSCTGPKSIPIKGAYLEKPFTVYSEKSVEDVWSKVIDIFATSGITIKIIDKSSGLIVTDDYSFLKSYTFETTGGNFKNRMLG